MVVQNVVAENIYDFMLNPNDEQYSAWWPGEHLAFHITKRGDKAHIGDEVYFDECLCLKRRLTFQAIVTAADRPNRIVWQIKKAGAKLPARLVLELYDTQDGLALTHELRLGFGGAIGKLADPFIRIYFNDAFKDDFERHCRAEWPKLAELLYGERRNSP
jgi:hypothetical protein